MSLISFNESPFEIRFSFTALIQQLEESVETNVGDRKNQILADLETLKQLPAFREGITDYKQTAGHEALISRLLQEYFPPALTSNEIKAVTVPYSSVILNHTKRFQAILKAAGPDFSFGIRDFDEHQFYVLSCCLIMNDLYGTNLDFSKPLFYDIPMANGVIKHYRILYNGDFLNVLKTPKSRTLSPEEIEQLMDNYDDLDLWKSKFPAGSYVIEGFAIMSLVDVTIENAVSLFKEKLLTLHAADFQPNIQSIFKSIFKNPNLNIGFALYNAMEESFTDEGLGYPGKSFLLNHRANKQATNVLCEKSYTHLIRDRKYFAISDLSTFAKQYPDSPLAHTLQQQNIGSVILAPVVKNDYLFGVLEVVAPLAHELNSINANKLDVVMPFLTDTIERLLAQFQNRIQAVIQRNYTSLHPSVYWKFRDAAKHAIANDLMAEPLQLPEILFDNVYPLYGQIDIKGSSDARNESTRKDLLNQLSDLHRLLKDISSVKIAADMDITPDFTSYISGIEDFITELSYPVHAGTEQYINQYLESGIHGMIDSIAKHPLAPRIMEYFHETNKDKGRYHHYRRLYDTTIRSINQKMITVIDEKQAEAQEIYPHYFERFKTDGVDHNLYIGDSISPGKNLTPRKLGRIRLWQLQTLCEMEQAHYAMRDKLPCPLEVTTLILLYTQPLAIRFRMDEKRFDVDGTYNARFEIVKKRIDKAYLKGTLKRLTEPGMIVIVYSDEAEAAEYKSYIVELQKQGMLDESIEDAELEDLQGLTGLKAMRVKLCR